MDIKFVRKNGANINNNDDYVPFKYAYGDIDGYTNGFTYSVNGNILHINGNSRIVVQGVESIIETGGIDIEFDIVNEKRKYLIYLSVNMTTQTSGILTRYGTTSYPFVDLIYDDITSSYGKGVAQIGLITLDVENGVISNDERVIKKIPFTKDIKVKNAEFSDEATLSYVSETQKNNDESNKIATTQFVKNVIRLNTLKLLLEPNSNNVAISNIKDYDTLTHFSFTISATYNGTTYRKTTGAIPKSALFVPYDSSDLGYDTEWGYGTSTSGTNQHACIRIYNFEFQVNVSSTTGSTEYKILEIYGYQEV